MLAYTESGEMGTHGSPSTLPQFLLQRQEATQVYLGKIMNNTSLHEWLSAGHLAPISQPTIISLYKDDIYAISFFMYITNQHLQYSFVSEKKLNPILIFYGTDL